MALGQAESDFADQPALRRMFENAVAIGKVAFGAAENPRLAAVQINGAQRVKIIAGLCAICANILHRRRAHRAGNQGQVFQPTPAVFQRPHHKVMPVLAGGCAHQPGFVIFRDQRLAHQFDLDHQRVEIAAQEKIAAAAQYAPRQGAERRIGAPKRQFVQIGKATQITGSGGQAKGVAVAQIKIGMDGHETTLK